MWLIILSLIKILQDTYICYIQTKRVMMIRATLNSISVTIYVSLTKILQDTTLCYIQAKRSVYF